jgi:hypothetical protein
VREASVTLSAVDIPYVSVQWEEEVNKLTQSMVCYVGQAEQTSSP